MVSAINKIYPKCDKKVIFQIINHFENVALNFKDISELFEVRFDSKIELGQGS